MTDAKGGISPGFPHTTEDSFFNRATPEDLEAAADWMIGKARMITRTSFFSKPHKYLCLAAVSLVCIAALRRQGAGKLREASHD